MGTSTLLGLRARHAGANGLDLSHLFGLLIQREGKAAYQTNCPTVTQICSLVDQVLSHLRINNTQQLTNHTVINCST